MKAENRKRKNLVKTYLDESELAHLNELIAESGLKKSDIVRTLIVNKRIKSNIDYKMLMALNSLGGLFKHALVTLKQSDSIHDYNFLRKSTNELLELIRNIHHDIKSNSKK